MYIFFGSSLNVVGNIQKEIFIFQNYIEMQDSYELIKLLLPEIVDYFELTSYKKGEVILHRYLKEINSTLKNIGKLSSKGFFDEITVQIFRFVDIRYIFTSRARGDLTKILDKLYLEIEFSSRRSSVTQEFASLKEIRFNPMTVMLLLLSMGLLKNYKINIKILSDFKIWNQNHTQKIGLSFQRT
jgi:hypothetical protein